eukprot:CAMPEP_0205811176 /NCGR_PEP_ID=MMETSP0205-20121125/15337_1 /ASSEMBLY_ACC=CAM_ASM_000278 /TAXON_ID=36767 /ORGANISM="Euplotes focardii, Strain TN1" /LENGTH=79 /DNA_ID=CAMNT_0053090007 /DNA_START=111 /DNA_END=347 /DNA_ORIENTATION=-
MDERDSRRSSRTNREVPVHSNGQAAHENEFVKASKFDPEWSEDKSMANRPTSYSSAHKRGTGTRTGFDNTPIDVLNLSD